MRRRGSGRTGIGKRGTVVILGTVVVLSSFSGTEETAGKGYMIYTWEIRKGRREGKSNGKGAKDRWEKKEVLRERRAGRV